MDPAKIQLSAKEKELVGNTELILTKNAILQKTEQLLAVLQSHYQEYLKEQDGNLPVRVMRSSPKISRGENYKGLPYRVLDYPRLFDPNNIFAVRTLFWWGHFFSITLHVSGQYKKDAEKKLVASFSLLKKAGFSVCINSDPWEHHFEEDNYKLLSKLNKKEFEKWIFNKPFVKLANKISLRRWDHAIPVLNRYFKLLSESIKE